MKKSLVTTLLVLLIIFTIPLNVIAFPAINIVNSTLINSYKASEHSREELYQEIKNQQEAIEINTYRILLKKQLNSSWMIYSATSDDSYSSLCEKKRKVANVDLVNLKEIEYKDYNYIMDLEKKDIKRNNPSSEGANTK